MVTVEGEEEEEVEAADEEEDGVDVESAAARLTGSVCC